MPTDNPYVRNQLYLIPVTELQPDPDQPRKFIDPDALRELTASVSQVGVLQPILFRSDNGAKYVVAGERRLAAARAAGLGEVPAIYTDGANYGEIALIENIQRADLNPVEEAEAMDRLMKSHSYKQDDLAGIFSKSKATISETLSLNRLPQTMRDECRKDPSVPKNVLVGIARKKQERSMLTAYQAYRKRTATPAGAKPAVRTSRCQRTIKAMSTAEEKMYALSIPDLLPDEQSELRQSLDAMEGAILEVRTRLERLSTGGPT